MRTKKLKLILFTILFLIFNNVIFGADKNMNLDCYEVFGRIIEEKTDDSLLLNEINNFTTYSNKVFFVEVLFNDSYLTFYQRNRNYIDGRVDELYKTSKSTAAKISYFGKNYLRNGEIKELLKYVENNVVDHDMITALDRVLLLIKSDEDFCSLIKVLASKENFTSYQYKISWHEILKRNIQTRLVPVKDIFWKSLLSSGFQDNLWNGGSDLIEYLFSRDQIIDLLNRKKNETKISNIVFYNEFRDVSIIELYISKALDLQLKYFPISDSIKIINNLKITDQIIYMTEELLKYNLKDATIYKNDINNILNRLSKLKIDKEQKDKILEMKILLK